MSGGTQRERRRRMDDALRRTRQSLGHDDENDPYGDDDPRRLADAIHARSPHRSSGSSIDPDGTVTIYHNLEHEQENY